MKMTRSLTAALLLPAALIAGCVRVDPETQRESTLRGESVDQVLAILIDTSGSFEDAWEGKAYPFLVNLIETYFHQSLGTKSVLQIAVLSETGRPVFWIASPRDFGKAFPSERHFLDRLAAEKQTSHSPINDSISDTIGSVRSTAGLQASTRATVVVLSDLLDTTEHLVCERVRGLGLTNSIKSFADEGGNIAFYYVHSAVVPQLHERLKTHGVPSDRYWIEGDNVFVPTPPNFY